jgi:uncharacterized damage-inducible protein DinB
MNEKEMFLKTWEREFQTTMKLLKAYPADKPDFKPHYRSRSAKELAWTFVMEEGLINMAIEGKIEMKEPPPPPKTIVEVITVYANSHKMAVEKVKQFPEADLEKTLKFPVGPKQMGDVRIMDMFWMMIMDMVHHRGQLSVYVRMAGGKVPSIYGPSADEPWM